MSEWWSYTLSDFLLFSPRTYYRLFELYNAAVWPGQVPAVGLGLALAAGLAVPGAWRGRALSGVLALCWLWVAWGFLYTRLATINWAAEYMAAAFAVEALFFVASGVLGNRLGIGAPRSRTGRAGLAIVLFAVLIQPLIGILAGRSWSQAELFGLAPDPTAVATLGVLLAAERARWELLLIPLGWCVVSGATLWTMEAPEAAVLPVIAGLTLVLRRLLADPADR